MLKSLPQHADVATLTGVLHHARLLDRVEPFEAGEYTVWPARHAWERVDIRCPYCRRKLARLKRGRQFTRIAGRIARVEGPPEDGRQPVVLESVPKGHTVGRCGRCLQDFTWPARRPKWLVEL